MSDISTNSKINIHFVAIGYFPFDFNISRIKKWKSNLFCVHLHEIANPLRTLNHEDGGIYKDEMLLEDINEISNTNSETFKKQHGFKFVLINSPIEEDWYSRILSPNAVVMSFSKIRDYLLKENIPLENAVITLFYMYSLFYKKFSRMPELKDEETFLHMDTRGCIFDMTFYKDEIIYCCSKAIICEECSNKLNILGKALIEKIKKELKQIKKPIYYRITDFLKRRPFLSIILTFWFTFSLSLISNYIINQNFHTNIINVSFFILIPILALIISKIYHKINGK